MKNKFIGSLVLSFALVAGVQGISGCTTTAPAIPAADNPSAPVTPEVGARMPDGTIYGGISDTQRQMFVAAADAPDLMDYDSARHFCTESVADGKKGFRLPWPDELVILQKNQDTGALAGTFNKKTNDPAAWYWSSWVDVEYDAWGMRFRDSMHLHYNKGIASSVRCIRYGTEK